MTRAKGSVHNLLARVGATLVAAYCLCACKGQLHETGDTSPPRSVTGVRTAVLQHERVPMELEYDGRAAGYRQVEVRARVKGVLLERVYREGSRVKQGDVLFRLEAAPYQVALKAAEAQLEESQARLRAAQRTRARSDTLLDSKMISLQARDDALAAYELASAAVLAAQAKIDAARLDLEYTEVKAPISGVAGMEARSVGSLVTPDSDSDLLTSITEYDPLYVHFAYPDADWQLEQKLISAGQLVVAGDGRRAVAVRSSKDGVELLGGYVDFTDVTVEHASGSVRARAILENKNGIVLPGQFVKIDVRGLYRTDALLVPQKALLRGPQGDYVYRLKEDGTAQVALLTVDRQTPQGWLVASGLHAGETIVVEGAEGLKAGDRVDTLEKVAQGAVSAEAAARGQRLRTGAAP